MPTMTFQEPVTIADDVAKHYDAGETPVPVSVPQVDPAPYGYKKDGTPRKPPGRRKGSGTGLPKRNNRKATQSGTDYTQGVKGIVQLAATALLVTGQTADAVTLTKFAEPLSTAVHNTAIQSPMFARVLDSIMTVGPYGELLAVVVPLALQLGTNHGRIPVGTFGTVSKDELLGNHEAT